jgi:hypothetical protein
MGSNQFGAFLPEPEPKLLRRDVCHTVLHFRVQPRLFTDSYSRAVNARAIPTVLRSLSLGYLFGFRGDPRRGRRPLPTERGEAPKEPHTRRRFRSAKLRVLQRHS